MRKWISALWTSPSGLTLGDMYIVAAASFASPGKALIALGLVYSYRIWTEGRE